MAEPTDTYDDLSVTEQDAYALSRAAVMIDQAKGDQAAVAAALDHNLELWTTISAVVSADDNPLPQEIKDNLIKLSKYVADTTFKNGSDATEGVLDSLININLQISQGLLEGQEAS